MAVTNDVMNGNREHVMLFAQPNQARTEQWAANQIKRQRCFFSLESLQSRSVLIWRKFRQVERREFRFERRINLLGIAIGRQSGAQGFVTAHYFLQGAEQRFLVQGPAQMKLPAFIVGA